MNYSEYRFTLDMQSFVSQISLPMRHLDTGRTLRISLTDGGRPYIIEDGCRAVFFAKKADGNVIMHDCIIENNAQIVYKVKEQTTACEGIVNCEIRLYGLEGEKITNPMFILVVDEKVVYDEDFPLSESEMSTLDNIIASEEARELAEEARAEAEEARAEAEEARAGVAEKAKAIAEEAEGIIADVAGEDNARGLKGFWIQHVLYCPTTVQIHFFPFRAGTARLIPDVRTVDTDNVYWDNYRGLKTGWAVGDEISIITPKNHYNCCGKIVRLGKLTDAQINCVLYTDIDWNAGDPVDNNDYCVYVPSKPDLGAVQISEGGFATGNETRAGGDYSFTEGVSTLAEGSYSHAEGLRTHSGYAAHAEGSNTKAIGKYAHAEGFSTTASGGSSHAEGENTVASGFVAHAEGRGTKATGTRAHSEGENTTASGDYSHAEGEESVASGGTSHAEGFGTEATASFAHTEGYKTKATNTAAHAEGRETTASGAYSHAEGQASVASGDYSHAEGAETVASGAYSHAEGSGAKASGVGSHAEGGRTEARSSYSHASGEGTRTSETRTAQTVVGRYNEVNDEAMFQVGNGVSNTVRSNAFEIISTRDGNGNHASMKLGNVTISEEQLTALLALLS